jgi:hypothetical protein
MRVLRPRGGVKLLLGGITGLLLLLSLSPVGAVSANLSRSYTASGPIPNGSLVSLSGQVSDRVEPANSDNGSRLLGVVLQSNDSLLAVDPAANKTQVATSGTADVLVSSLGGSIKVGDEIGVSPFSGIGMKASPGSRVIGLAQSEFKQGSQGAADQTVTDKDGKKARISVGYTRVSIAIATDGTLSAEARLNGLQRFAQGLTGHTVSSARVLISLLIAIIALLVLVTLTYAAIYGSIISIGRNPLAKYAVFRTLSSVLGIAFLTAGFAAVSIFFLLK